jgi:hypothetical protein
MKEFLLALTGGLALLAVPAAGRAARVEADPNKEYVISPEAGPYVICVKAYTGPRARELANQLALHLRQNGWPAYVFDYTAEEKRKAQELLDERYRALPPDAPRPRKTVHVEEQWGVLIGGYRDFDSASRDVPKVKDKSRTPWPKMDKTAFDHFVKPDTGEVYQVSPYAYALATRNPTVRAPKADPNAPDPRWKDLNDGRPYNLLKCGKPWTLVVKQFQGIGVMQSRSESSKFLELLSFGSKPGDVLEASAKQAEEVAKFLRAANFEAYVLHTRSGSIVTVGAYDSADDPRLRQTAEKLAGKRLINNDKDGLFQLFPQPLPMKVPQL